MDVEERAFDVEVGTKARWGAGLTRFHYWSVSGVENDGGGLVGVVGYVVGVGDCVQGGERNMLLTVVRLNSVVIETEAVLKLFASGVGTSIATVSIVVFGIRVLASSGSNGVLGRYVYLNGSVEEARTTKQSALWVKHDVDDALQTKWVNAYLTDEMSRELVTFLSSSGVCDGWVIKGEVERGRRRKKYTHKFFGCVRVGGPVLHALDIRGVQSTTCLHVREGRDDVLERRQMSVNREALVQAPDWTRTTRRRRVGAGRGRRAGGRRSPVRAGGRDVNTGDVLE
ncbi:hypothetical protein L227DRAFT_568666 [Lentinus tigrinus ALCF2SS1-6]|uniref:Uncharacterized protein n=1 Tax=Lentinus tigrinus ALCF2SS1-6 TaxID=1328759 RepID=A0A5C2RL72_9APHY|nr:hypothetical protein L227DRAFT_568666 [Lentinus tigrinus ALCF2SS1-6]